MARDPARSPKRRREGTRESFEAKVSLLEEWAKNGLPYNARYPTSHAALRQWTGPEGQFGIWKDPTIDRVRTGKYPALADRFVKAIGLIIGRKDQFKKSMDEASAQLDQANSKNAALVIQNAELLSRIDVLERKCRHWKALADARSP